MREYLPILILGGIIGLFTLVFVAVYAAEKNKKETMGFDRNMPDREIVRRLLAYAKPYWKSFALCFVIMVFSIVYDLTSPLLVGHIEETVKGTFTLGYLFSVVAVYAGILIVSLVCTFLQAMILQKTGQKILSSIREDVFSHIQSLFVGQGLNVGEYILPARRFSLPSGRMYSPTFSPCPTNSSTISPWAPW